MSTVPNMEENPPNTIEAPGDHSAGRRAREVYRYFRPERLAPVSENGSFSSGTSSRRSRILSRDLDDQSTSTTPQFQDSTSTSSPQPSISQSTEEHRWPALGSLPESMVLGESSSTLNSFAQLAALRLNVDRVFISVSDRDSQFIIAQAAQTASGGTKYDFLSDGVYAGCSTIDASRWSMCKDTLALPPSDRLEGEYSFLVSNDLRQDERYKHLPFVQGEPNFQFYAGTPLTTDSNINMGCFFVLDTKPHDEFTYLEKETMGHMGMLIMDFLKVCRQASEGRRAAQLSRGLSCFVEGRSSFMNDLQHPQPLVTENTSTNRPSSLSSKRSESRRFKDRLDVSCPSSERSRSRSSGARSFCSTSEPSDEEFTPSSFDSKQDLQWSQSKGKHDGDSTHRGNSWTFKRAANLIRESLGLGGNDGVVFVEAGNDHTLNHGSDSEFSSSMDNSQAVSVLALSTEDNAHDIEPKHPVSRSIVNLDEDFLRRLLHRYTKGRIWSFHSDGLLSSSDGEEKETSHKARGRANPSARRSKAQKRKINENAILNKCFPGATQILFIPLWNSARSQWFGGFFCWNTVESNVFNPEVELSSLLGFGSSIMSECNRVDSLIADRQKGDFLGSISHELRSPLHGVLAAAEMMQSTELTPYQSSLMDTIDACGRTLLDTMNQVLDYSKIVSLERQLRHLKKRGDNSPSRQIKHRSATRLDVYKPTDLSNLVEEVVEGVCLGHRHSQQANFSDFPAISSDSDGDHGKTNDDHSPVKVTLDIAHHDWVYNTAPGALRRIIMNIFSNAMKYTSEGHISLRLAVKECFENGHQNAQKADMVTITVSDTGKGISDDFLRERLFVPFAQEDSLASGSGLGLSIVRSLLKSLVGDINIQSKPGEGTTVKVIIPLYRSDPDDCPSATGSISPYMQTSDGPSTSTEIERIRKDFSGRKVAIWGMEPDLESSHQFFSVVSHYLTDWYGLEVVSPSSKAAIDILLAKEIPSEIEISQKYSSKPSLLLMSDKGVRHDSMRIDRIPAVKSVNIMHLPFGPHKLARVIRKCFEDPIPPPVTIISEDLRSISDQPKKPPIHEQPTIIGVGKAQSDSNGTTPTTDSISKDTSDDSTKKRQARILVVEDNMINLNLMLTFLKKRKLPTLDSAENGQSAVAAVKDNPNYDIIFMDISMPVMDGFEATRNIRAIEKERNSGDRPATIIALTGLSGHKDESEALDSGMNLFLTKPVAFKQVTRILNEWDDTESSGQI